MIAYSREKVKDFFSSNTPKCKYRINKILHTNDEMRPIADRGQKDLGYGIFVCIICTSFITHFVGLKCGMYRIHIRQDNPIQFKKICSFYVLLSIVSAGAGVTRESEV